MESTKLVMEKTVLLHWFNCPSSKRLSVRDNPSDAISSNLQDNYKTIRPHNSSHIEIYEIHNQRCTDVYRRRTWTWTRTMWQCHEYGLRIMDMGTDSDTSMSENIGHGLGYGPGHGQTSDARVSPSLFRTRVFTFRQFFKILWLLFPVWIVQ